MPDRTGAALAPPLHIVAWPGDPAAVQLIPAPSTVAPTSRQLKELLAHLKSRPLNRVLTAALDPSALRPYAEAGFEVCSSLALLRRDLTHPIANGGPTQRSHRRHWSDLAAIDRAAFGLFWSLDVPAIERAVEATTARRVRTVGADHPVGYAVSGAAGAYGYLQRLAVDPASWGQGHATALVLDSLSWMRRLGARNAVVNTEEANQRARALYERLGFTTMSEGLYILEALL